MTESHDNCRICGKPVLADEARYAACEPEEACHWDCHVRQKREFDEAAERFKEKMDEAIDSLKKIRGSLRD